MGQVKFPEARDDHRYHQDARRVLHRAGRLRDRSGTYDPGNYYSSKFCKILQILAGSFSAVSKRNFARKYAFDSIFQSLQDVHTSAPLQTPGVNCVDLGESFQTHIFLQNFVSLQPRTIPVKFARSKTLWLPFVLLYLAYFASFFTSTLILSQNYDTCENLHPGGRGRRADFSVSTSAPRSRRAAGARPGGAAS